ncbi:MAG: Type I secretion outer membrane protein, TolC family [uncultured Sphingomonadaceae bacterium]|uniref:Type I secretion outer membrane protein, TolC family n=1 Tax=uncultured Sphingomonadaceae bacterium TaxID=169976 RepID=A0A6J4STB6_9SPHN|nr:MAG: Type I secretion outer membrane protein, TolC family [uncultured Sphingomonadaceae bacterium]
MRSLLLLGAAPMILAITGAAQAATLREALARTYTANPTINASRAQVRTLDEGVAVARAQRRPQISATGGLNQDLTRTGGGVGRNLNLGVDVSYPLFTGGRVRNQIRAADVRVEAGRANLRATEGDVFTEATGAYMDVIRDRSIVSLNENQVRVLQTNLEATRDRFEIGDLTRTDVAQSEARLALARSQLANAQGRLTSSEENYRRVVGALPDTLAPPPPLPTLPGTPDQAVAIAIRNNPDLASINAQVQAAGLDVQVTRANRLPTVSAIASGRATNYLGTADEQFAPGAADTQTQTGLGVQARIPIYQGGLVGAQVRQAQSQQSQLLEQGVGIERQIVANARAAFANYRAAQDAIRSNEVAVSANTLALEGARLENTVGTRTVLEVLNAEQELLNSQVQLVTARRDAYVAGFALLNAMGRAEARDLGLEGGALYDPVTNYERIIRRRSDWDQNETPTPDSTRTVPPEMQGPVTRQPN